MAEPIIVTTGKYKKEGKVSIDGHVWSIKLPGAGTDLVISQAQRRINFLDRKIKAGTETEADLDAYDRYEKLLYSSFKNMLSDGTDDNATVVKWVKETPLAIILAIFEDIKKASNGSSDTPSSS